MKSMATGTLCTSSHATGRRRLVGPAQIAAISHDSPQTTQAKRNTEAGPVNRITNRAQSDQRACWMADNTHRPPGARSNVQSSVAVTCSVGLPSIMRPAPSRVTSIMEKRIATVA